MHKRSGVKLDSGRKTMQIVSLVAYASKASVLQGKTNYLATLQNIFT